MRKLSILGICFYGFSVIAFVVMASMATVCLHLDWISANWRGVMLHGILTWLCCSMAVCHWKYFIFGLKKIIEEEEKR